MFTWVKRRFTLDRRISDVEKTLGEIQTYLEADELERNKWLRSIKSLYAGMERSRRAQEAATATIPEEPQQLGLLTEREALRAGRRA